MKIFDVEETLAQMTLEEKAQMCSGRDFWCTQDIERLGIPKVMMCDGPNGLRKQEGEADHLGINASIETVCYPTASAMASSFDADILRELGENLGEECQAENVAMLLGPGVNMKRSPLCGRNFEYFSEDPYLAGKLASAYIQGLQSKGVAACVKHFACNDQESFRLSGSSNLDERALHETYLPAFEMSVNEGKTRSIMNAYNAINGTFCAENKELLTEILRDDWGYQGFVVTDWGAVKDRVDGILAGCDLEMPGATEGKTESIVKAVESGRLPQEKLNQAVRNVLTFVHDALSQRQEGTVFDRKAALEKAAEMEAECAILLKNKDRILPLRRETKVAFIGEYAQEPRYQGSGSSHINVKHAISALEYVCGRNVTFAKGYESRKTQVDAALQEEAIQAAREADTAVIFAGLPDSFETEGADRETMSMPENQNALIAAVCAVQPNTVVVLHGGAPMEMPWLPIVKGVLLMYLGGAGVGKATAELLYGEKNPSGKLAETWPVKVSDNPSWLNFPGENGIVEYREGIFIGYRYYDKKEMAVNFSFGHGLSYTDFAYSDLTFDKTSVVDPETLTVSCKVRNTGKRAGKEAVQLYVGIPGSRVRRPIRELKAFAKVSLEAGEEKTVSFTLDRRAFAYYEPKIHDWFVENTDAVIEIGSSSRDIRLKASIPVTSDQTLPLRYTRYSTIADLLLTKKGTALFNQMFRRPKSEEELKAQAESDAAMGDGAEKMREKMMMEMPLNAFYSYGMMTEEQMLGLVESLNQE